MALLASYRDDCWEPDDAAKILREIAERGASKGTPICLRVEGRDLASARVIDGNAEIDRSELPGTASYLWALWSESPPSRDELVALYREFLRAESG